MRVTSNRQKQRRHPLFAVLCCGPLLVAFAGCPFSPRNLVVDGMMRSMQPQTEEATYQRMRNDMEASEGRLIAR